MIILTLAIIIAVTAIYHGDYLKALFFASVSLYLLWENRRENKNGIK